MTLPRLIPTAEPTQQAQNKGPFLLTAFVLWILALRGIFLVILTWLPLRIKRSLLHRELRRTLRTVRTQNQRCSARA